MPILAAISGEHEDDRIVEVGHELATGLDLELVVLHVMEQDQFEELRNSSNPDQGLLSPGTEDVPGGIMYNSPDQHTSTYYAEDAQEDAADVAEKCISGSLTDNESVPVSAKGLVGDPSEEIIGLAERIDAEYVVVGGRKRSPVGKALFGSVSQSVILNTERPVVSIYRTEQT